MSLDPIIVITLRLGTILLFAAALAHKLWDAAEFERVLRGYLQGLGLEGRDLEKPLFLAIVALEFLVLGACLLPSAQMAAGLLASSTLLVYAFVMAGHLRRGNVLLDCGCTWGKSGQTLRPALVVRNATLAVLALAMTLPAGNRELAAVDIISIIVATLTAAALYTAGNQILSLGYSDRRENS